jgi:hypothetical protein
MQTDLIDPVLALILGRWPELPEAVRAGIMAIIRASTEMKIAT